MFTITKVAIIKLIKIILKKKNILEKENEAIWFVNNKTVKFSTDTKFISDRVKRTKYLGNYVPSIVDSSENFYTYNFVKGEVFSKKVTGKRFEYLLSWLDDFWKPIQLTHSEEKEFQHSCEVFYNNKTCLNNTNLTYSL